MASTNGMASLRKMNQEEPKVCTHEGVMNLLRRIHISDELITATQTEFAEWADSGFEGWSHNTANQRLEVARNVLDDVVSGLCILAEYLEKKEGLVSEYTKDPRRR